MVETGKVLFDDESCEEDLDYLGVGMENVGMMSLGLPSLARNRSERRTEVKSGVSFFCTLGTDEGLVGTCTLGNDVMDFEDDVHEREPIRGIILKEDIGWLQLTYFLDEVGDGGIEGFGATRLSKVAISRIA